MKNNTRLQKAFELPHFYKDVFNTHTSEQIPFPFFLRSMDLCVIWVRPAGEKGHFPTRYSKPQGAIAYKLVLQET
jgi:hypothetical protein